MWPWPCKTGDATYDAGDWKLKIEIPAKTLRNRVLDAIRHLVRPSQQRAAPETREGSSRKIAELHLAPLTAGTFVSDAQDFRRVRMAYCVFPFVLGTGAGFFPTPEAFVLRSVMASAALKGN